METWIIPWLTIIWLRFGLLLLGALTELLLLTLLPVIIGCGSCWPGGSAACPRGGDFVWWCVDRRWWLNCCCRKSENFKGEQTDGSAFWPKRPHRNPNLITIWRRGSAVTGGRTIRMVQPTSYSATAIAARRTSNAAITPTTAVWLGSVTGQEAVAISGAIKGLAAIRVRRTSCGALLRRWTMASHVLALGFVLTGAGAALDVVVVQILCN